MTLEVLKVLRQRGDITDVHGEEWKLDKSYTIDASYWNVSHKRSVERAKISGMRMSIRS